MRYNASSELTELLWTVGYKTGNCFILHHEIIDWIAEQYPTAQVTLPMPYEELDSKLIESVKYIINEQKKQRGS